MQVHETQATDSDQPGFDATRRYVRVCEQRPDGFVEFEFAIGDPALCVELMLKAADFHEFCLANDVIVLGQAEAGQGDWAARMNKASRLESEGSDETTNQPVEAPMTKGHTYGN
jgi:phenol hydroxylase P0 protein